MNENITHGDEKKVGDDLTSEKGVVDHMSASTSEQDWNKRCDEVKAANGGGYPDFWYFKVIMSGLGNRVASKW